MSAWQLSSWCCSAARVPGAKGWALGTPLRAPKAYRMKDPRASARPAGPDSRQRGDPEVAQAPGQARVASAARAVRHRRPAQQAGALG